MKFKLLPLFFVVFFLNCRGQDCQEKISLLPMYGGVEKCPEQLAIDKSFLASIDQVYPNRKEAARLLVERAWSFLYTKDYENAMKRFNQAWLLNPDSYEVYWGFGNLVAGSGKPKEAITYFEMAKQHNPTNSNFYTSSASAYFETFQADKKVENRDKGLADLEAGLKLDDKNPKIYFLLSVTYFHLDNIKKAKEYLAMAENIDSASVDPEFRKMLSSR